jgi:hypothetical protein
MQVPDTHVSIGCSCKGCVLFFQNLDQILDDNDRMRKALEVISQWDVLNPPQTMLLSDLKWLRGIVDNALGKR